MQAEASNSRKGRGRGRGRGSGGNQGGGHGQPGGHRPQPREETAHVPRTPPQPKYATPETPPPTPPDGAMQHNTSLQPAGLAPMARCSGDGSPESVALELAGLSFEQRSVNSKFPRRPDYGRNGVAIQLVANHFEVSLPSGNIFHYDVDISVRKQGGTQSVVSKDCKRRVFILLVEQHAKHLNGNLPVFDGQKNMYTKNSLGFKKQSFTVVMEEEGGARRDEFVVQIQFAAQLDLSLMRQLYNGKSRTPEVPKAVVQALEIILRYGPSTRLSVVGRSLFRPPRGDASLSGGLELWHGFQTSLRPGQWKPFVNVNTMVTAFFEPGPLVSLMGKILGDRRGDLNMDQVQKLDNSQILRLNKKLKKLKVQATHLPYRRRYVIEKVTAGSANDLTFGDPPQTVAAYFKSTYRELRYPNLPCVEVGSKRNYIPVEVCEVMAGQHCKRKLDENQTSAVVRKAAVPPQERFRNIQDDVRGCIAANKQYLDHFGIRMSDKPLQLTARVLPAPNVVYRDDNLAHPNDGAWELTGMQFLQPVSMTVWTIVNTCNPRFCPEAAIQNFVSMLMQNGKQLGMNIAPPAKVTNCRPSDDPKRVLCEQKRQFKDIQIVFFVLGGSGRSSPFYSPLKNVAETDLGMVTQCVTDQSILKKCNRATIVNILQKVNAKLGGINNAIPKEMKAIVFNRPVIVMGADVTHPAPTEMNKPSIAAVVASMDRFAFRYIATFRIQKQNTVAKARIEIIEDMKNIAKSLLLSFYQVNNVKPEKIIFYRDGVSEGQFSHVQQFELAALRDACRELELGYEPGITFLTVQKRHHTRFMPRNRSDGRGKSGNVPPGTVVDTDVTHPVDFDFFLCSHFGIQGTSRPAHYYVLWDDNDFKADTLQQLTYGLCHTYARCSRSVSIPTPVYYAHHATKRAKCYVDARTDGSDSGSSSGGTMLPTSVLDDAVKISTLMEKKMFFI